MVKWEHFLRLLWPLLVVVNLVFPSLGCVGTLGQEYPQARIYGVCAAPYSVRVETEPEKRVWLYGPNGELVSRRNPEQFTKLAAKTRAIFVFDEQASRDSPSALPSPDNQLECQTGISWLPPQELEEMPYAGGCRGNCPLPDSSVLIAPFAPCPIDNLRQSVSYLQEQGGDRPDVRMLGQTQAPIRSGFLQPLPGVAYAPDCRALMREELKKQIRVELSEYGKRVGNVIGSALAGWNTFANSGNERIRNEFANDPQVIATLQNYVAARLDEIPAPKEYSDPELAGIALAAFEDGYGQSLATIQVQFAAFDATCTLLILASGPIAATAETAAAKALRLALARTRALPIFLPTAIGGGAFLRRLPRTPSTTAAPPVMAQRTPVTAPATRPPAVAPPVIAKTVTRPKSSPAPTNAPKTNTPTTTTTTAPQAAPSGELHHGISSKVFDALEDHKNLKGKFKLRDPQFTARAVDKEAHNGYQDWHKKLDEEIVNHIRNEEHLTPKDFAAWLYKRYRQPDLAKRFPGGLGTNK